MRLHLLHVRFDARDFRLQDCDPFMQLLDRHRVEVLLAKLDQGIPRLAWEEIVQIHRQIVDP